MRGLVFIAVLFLAGCGASESSVLVVGDSVELHYMEFVSAEDPNATHNGACDQFYNWYVGDKENAGNSQRAAACINKWLDEGHYTTVHFNTGLHDIRRDHCRIGDETPEVDLSDYLINLQIIVDAIRAHGAEPIFATTTPIIGDQTCHSNADVIRYNSAAVRMMQSQGIEIDDLYSYMLPFQEQYHLPNNIHFNDQGYMFLAAKVLSSISAR